MTGVPATLPAGLYEAATRRGSPAQTSRGPPPGSQGPIPRQFSGTVPRTSSPLARAPYGVPSPTTAGPGRDWDWDVTPQEKQQYDGLFEKVDTGRNGFITGEQAVVFFSESGLSEDYLAQIWDLSDIQSEGRLNRDEFAVAMYLIRLQRGKPASVLPTALPERLIPPSMRNQRPNTQTTAPAFDNAAHSTGISKSASEDLFGLDALTSSPPTAQIPQSTGGSAAAVRARDADPFGSQPSSPRSPTTSQFLPAASTGSFKPFQPTSAFGQGLKTQDTGASAGSSASPPRGVQRQASNMDDLLGDNDPEISKKLTKETTELANMSNQIGTLRTQMEDVQAKKTTTENDLNRTSTQKRDLELRLSQFRTQYENEIRNVKALEERLNASRADTEKLKRDYAMVEGSFHDLQNQHRQVGEALTADQRENANLKQKIGEMNAEINQLKPQLEKMRSDARQQKGLVAINKKQLSTSEGERDKIKTEMGDLSRAAEERARQSPAPESATVASPAASISSQSTNPFFRRTTQQSFDNAKSPAQTARSPPTQTQENFDNFFGSSSFTSPQGTVPPQTSFRSESNVPTFNQTGSSVISSDPGFPTPSTSPPLSSYQESPQQPPAPPESRQMTSNQLPFREPAARTESMGSSVRVGTPGSRLGATGTDTPINVSSPAPPSAGSRGLERNDSNKTETFNAFDRPSTASPASGSNAIPGAFPDPTPGPPTTDSKSDFDAAFANYGSTRPPQQERQNTGSSLNGSVASAPPTKFNQEFPPIQDIGHDDDDDSDTSDDQGFDDNFGSPERKKGTNAPPPEPIQTQNDGPPEDVFTPRPMMQHLGSTASAMSDLPTPNAQASPPTYGETMSHERSGSNSFPPEFGGLLPSREDPTTAASPPPQQEYREPSPEDRFGGPVGGGGGQGHALFGGGPSSSTKASSPPPVRDDSGSTPSDAYQSAVSYASTQNKSPSGSQPPQLAKPSFADDFDTGFDDLDEAKEGEHDESDDFIPASQHHEGFDDFNPTFDSPAASKTNTMASLGTTPTSKPAVTSQPMENSFGDFEQDIENAFGNSSGAAAKSGGQEAGAGSTNWDDIFGSMDKPSGSKPDTSASGSAFSFPELPSRTNVHDDDDAITTAPPVPPREPENKTQMPPLGRALTAGTEHDDPILKQLTSKGFERGEALNTLEKYDYDFNKVCLNYQLK